MTGEYVLNWLKVIRIWNDAFNEVNSESPLKDVLCKLTDSLDELDDSHAVTILLNSTEGLRPIAGKRLPEAWVKHIDPLPLGAAQGSCGTAGYLKQTVIVENILESPLWADYTQYQSLHGFMACWSEPILSQGKLLGTFAIYFKNPRQPEPHELDIIKSLAISVSTIIVRKKRDQELKLIRNRLSRAEQLSHLGSWSWDLTNNELYWTDEVYRIFGEEPQNFRATYDTFLKYIHPEDRAMVQRAVENTFATISPYSIDHRIVRKDGFERVVQEAGEIHLNSAGEPASMIGTVQDITERRQIEEDLKSQRNRLKYIIEGTNVGTWEWNVQTGETIFNERWANIIGYTLDEITPVSIDSWLKLSHPEDLAQSDAALEKHFRGESEYYNIECRIKHKSGHWVWVLDRGKVISWTDDGKPLWMYGTHQDITERKQYEKTIQKAAVKYKAILQTAIDGFWLTDLKGKLLEVNDAYCRMSGYSENELLSMRIPELEGNMGPDEVAAKIDEVKRKDQDRFETRHRHKDGGLYEVEVSIQYLANDNGKLFVFLRDISERKKSEQRLHRLSETWKLAQEAANIGHWSYDIKSQQPIWSDQMYKVLGCDPKEGVPGYEAHKKIIHPEDWELFDEAVQGAISGTPYNIELRTFFSDGSIHWCNAQGFPHREPDGNVFEVFGTTQDITERKQAEISLQESEAKMRSILDNVGIGVALISPDMKVMELNRQMREWFPEVNPEQRPTCYQSFNNPPSETKCDYCPACKTLRDGKVHEAVTYTPRPEGIRNYRLVTSPIFDPSGRVAAVIEITEDITERKQIEEMNEMSIMRFQALMQLNQMKEATLTEITDFALEEAIRLTRSKIGYLAFLNDDESVIIMHSWSESAMKECAIKDKPRHYPLSDTGLWGEAVRQRKTIITNDYLVPNPLKKGTPVGHVSILRHMNTPIFDGDRMVIVAGVANKEDGYTQTDADQISLLMQGMWRLIKQKQAEEESVKLHNQLIQAQKMESVGRLAGGVAHDFNNMLGVILGHAELALEQTDPAQQVHTALQEIMKAARRSADITRQLLAFARKQTISPKVVDINKTIEGMTSILRRLIGENIDLKWLPTKSAWPVMIDPTQIDQILANLCVNARDAILNVGKITIETDNTEFDETYCKDHLGFLPGEYVLLAVSDNGCGMSAETLDNIFEPFFTTKSSDKGTGLGLSTVYGIVRQNKGFVNVYSEPGHGTTFRIYLPRHRAQKDLITEKEKGHSAEHGDETILLVEDEPAILEMTKIMLDRLGYAVVAARTPGEAIAIAREHKGAIHLLVTDVVMPEMNGWELARSIRTIHPDIKRLFMSGYTANVIAHHGVLEKGINFIHKPFSKALLGEKIRETLDEDKS